MKNYMDTGTVDYFCYKDSEHGFKNQLNFLMKIRCGENMKATVELYSWV